jgi:hypothetical protein
MRIGRKVAVGFAVLALLVPRVARADAAKGKGKPMNLNLAFVLLAEAKLPEGEDVERAFAAYAGKGQVLSYRPGKPKKAEGAVDGIEFDTGGGGRAVVALMPVAVPNREADEAVRYSISAMNGRWKLPPHKAHLVVTGQGNGKAVDDLGAFTSLVAAVVDVSHAVGVYCGNAGATHDPKFFTETAHEHAIAIRLTLWNGVSIARADDGRLELLSLGMGQLGLPNLLLVVPKGKANDAIPALFDLLADSVSRGAAIPDGDTVGPTEHDRWPVRYVTSPVDPKAKVWRVEMK